jgi:hypothetical protein
MNAKNPLILMSSALLLAAFISACDREGPAEQAGEQVDEAVQAAGEKIEQAQESAAETAESAGDKVESATDR